MKTVLQEVTQADIPTELSERLAEEKRIETVRLRLRLGVVSGVILIFIIINNVVREIILVWNKHTNLVFVHSWRS